MFKWTFQEEEKIVDSKTGLQLYLRGLDSEIMAIKDWWTRLCTLSASDWSIIVKPTEIHGKIYFCLRQNSRCMFIYTA